MADTAGREGDGLRASVRSHVTRARFEVEVVGSVDEISAVFDDVLASVARHFPGMEVTVGAEPGQSSGTAVDVDVDAPEVPKTPAGYPPAAGAKVT